MTADGFSRRESILGLERIAELTRLLGDPQDACPAVHVAGTNGKGSFCAMLSSILTAAGLKVGMFTSPALLGDEESLRISGKRVGADTLADILSFIEPYALSMGERPTEFEVMTAAAFELFRREGCDMTMIECGLGGDGDSTNVIKSPLLSVITNVQFDHMGRLGSTLSEIASHKAGIIKPGRPVLFGGASPEALEVIRGFAARAHAPLYLAGGGYEVISSDITGTEAYFPGFGRERLSLLGEYQAENAANVLKAVTLLRALGVAIPDAAVENGLSHTSWPGRNEVICSSPTVVFDGAHNPAGVAHAAHTAKDLLGGRVVLLMGVLADKDRSNYPALLAPYAEALFAVRPESPRALDPEVLAAEFAAAGVPSRAFDRFDKGVREAYNYAKEHSLPLFAIGSLYMYGGFRSALDELLEEETV